MPAEPVPIIDLFAGPGGLGEGFASLEGNPFKILISAEKDTYANQTLRLRAYYRLLSQERPDKLHLYLDYCNGQQLCPWNHSTEDLWHKAKQETPLIELGSSAGNSLLDSTLQKKLTKNDRSILIGGPPCQAITQ